MTALCGHLAFVLSCALLLQIASLGAEEITYDLGSSALSLPQPLSHRQLFGAREKLGPEELVHASQEDVEPVEESNGGSSSTDKQPSAACPDWLKEYVDWHGQLRGGADAKYLMFQCSSSNKGRCPGIGDRFRGMAFAAKLAVHLKR